jgi:hypothetical protein
MKSFTSNQGRGGSSGSRERQARTDGGIFDAGRRIAALEKKKASGDLTTGERLALVRLKSVHVDLEAELRQALGLRPAITQE